MLTIREQILNSSLASAVRAHCTVAIQQDCAQPETEVILAIEAALDAEERSENGNDISRIAGVDGRQVPLTKAV